MIEARSIHAIPPKPVDDEAPQSFDEIEQLPKLRSRTNDPAREYAQRGGEVRRLPDSIAALILSKKGWAKIERHQIKVTLDGEDLFFASRDSLVIAAKNGTGERVLWVMNRRAPDVLHLLTDDGRYIESVPRKGEATWFDHGAASQAAHADATAQIQRDARRLQELHRPDTEAAAAAAQHNAAQTRRLIQTFPVPGHDRSPSPEDEDFDKANRIVEAMENVETQRTRRTEQVQTEARRLRAEHGSLADLRPAFSDAAEEEPAGERESFAAFAPLLEPPEESPGSLADLL